MDTEVRVKEEAVLDPEAGSTSGEAAIKREIPYDDEVYLYEDCPPGPADYDGSSCEIAWVKTEPENTGGDSGSESDVILVDEDVTEVKEKPAESSATSKSVKEAQGAQNEFGVSCPRCSLTFKSEASLEAHFFIHTGEKPLECPFCPKNFKFVETLNQHIKFLHAKESFCDRCMTQIRDAKDVKKHLVRSEQRCTRCPAKFATQCELIKHNRELHDERPFVCNICQAAYGKPNHLALHKRSHVIERPAQCPLCSETFRQRRHLKTHMHAHFRAANRFWSCTACPANFKRKRDLKEHLKLHAD